MNLHQKKDLTDRKPDEDCPYRKRCDERVYEELPRFCDLPDDDDTLV